MADQKLSAREEAVLRLFAQGHDAKSAAEMLDLSVHTVNDYLRTARRKLGVSSSRAAARALTDEAGFPKKLGTEFLGDDSVPSQGVGGRGAGWTGVTPATALAAGVVAMSILALSIIALSPPTAPLPPEPVVTATLPASDSLIAPGPFTLSVTFDRPMRADSFSVVQVSRDTYPDCAGIPAQSRDRQTFTMNCTAVASRQYEVWFNRPPYMNFLSVDGLSARPHRLRFGVRNR